MTFSIVGHDPAAGTFGVAVSSAVPCVGACCAWTSPTGAVVTQSWTNPYIGVDGLTMLARGATADQVRAHWQAADPEVDERQFAVLDRTGGMATWTGQACVDWAGHRQERDASIQGNMLVGPQVLEAMAAAWSASAGTELAERLMRSLEAGQRAGGDKRGRQSAALRVSTTEDYPWLDVRVDEHADPVPELRRVLNVALAQWVPFAAMMPTRASPGGRPDPEATRMLGLPPVERPSGVGDPAPSLE